MELGMHRSVFQLGPDRIPVRRAQTPALAYLLTLQTISDSSWSQAKCARIRSLPESRPGASLVPNGTLQTSVKPSHSDSHNLWCSIHKKSLPLRERFLAPTLFRLKNQFITFARWWRWFLVVFAAAAAAGLILTTWRQRQNSRPMYTLSTCLSVLVH